MFVSLLLSRHFCITVSPVLSPPFLLFFYGPPSHCSHSFSLFVLIFFPYSNFSNYCSLSPNSPCYFITSHTLFPDTYSLFYLNLYYPSAWIPFPMPSSFVRSCASIWASCPLFPICSSPLLYVTVSSLPLMSPHSLFISLLLSENISRFH